MASFFDNSDYDGYASSDRQDISMGSSWSSSSSRSDSSSASSSPSSNNSLSGFDTGIHMDISNNTVLIEGYLLY